MAWPNHRAPFHMSYNNNYNYAPYYQSSDQNPSGSNQQSFPRQQKPQQKYYHVDSSTPSNESYGNQRQYSTLSPPQANPTSYGYQSYRHSDGNPEQISRGEGTHVGQSDYSKSSRFHVDTSALGSLAYASALGSNTSTDQGALSRQLPSPTEPGASAVYSTASSRSTSGFLPPPIDSRSIAHDNRSQAYNSHLPQTASLAASALAQARRQTQIQSQNSTAPSSSSHPAKPATTAEQRPQARTASQQSQMEGDPNGLYKRNIRSPVDSNQNCLSFQPPLNSLQQPRQAYRSSLHNTAPDTPTVPNHDRTAQNTLSNHRETSNRSPVLPASFSRNNAQSNNVQGMRGPPVNYNTETLNIQATESEKNDNIVSPPMFENHPQTVDPNQVFNQQEYQGRKAAAEAAAQTAKEAARKVFQPSPSAESSKAGSKDKEKEKREGEIKSLLGSMFGYMREMKAKDPEMFLQVWQDFKKDQPLNRASSQPPAKESHPALSAPRKTNNIGSPPMVEDNQLPSPSQIIALNTFTPDPPVAQERPSDFMRHPVQGGEQFSHGNEKLPSGDQHLTTATSHLPDRLPFRTQVESDLSSLHPKPNNARKTPFKAQVKPSPNNARAEPPSTAGPKSNSQRPGSTVHHSVRPTSSVSAHGAGPSIPTSISGLGSRYIGQNRPMPSSNASKLHGTPNQQPLQSGSRQMTAQGQTTQPLVSANTAIPNYSDPKAISGARDVVQSLQPDIGSGMPAPAASKVQESKGVGLGSQNGQSTQPNQKNTPDTTSKANSERRIRRSDARNLTKGTPAKTSNLQVQTGHVIRSRQYLMDRARTGFAQTSLTDANKKNRPPPGIASPSHVSLSKAEMARKRSFSEIVDLTLGESDDEEPTKKAMVMEATSQSELPKEPARDALESVPSVQSQPLIDMPIDPRLLDPLSRNVNRRERSLLELVNANERNEPLTDREKLRLAVVAKPIDEKDVIRRPFNPKTFARDLMISTGTHPTEKPLNWHLMGLLKRFLHINDNTDLSTLRWDLLDPGGPERIPSPSTDEDTDVDVDVPDLRVNPVPQQRRVGVDGDDHEDMDMVGLVHEERARSAKNSLPLGQPRRGRPKGRYSQGFLHNTVSRIPSSAFTIPTRTLADTPQTQTSIPSTSVLQDVSSQADRNRGIRSGENPAASYDLSQLGAGVVPTSTPQNILNRPLSTAVTPGIPVVSNGSARDESERRCSRIGRPPGSKNKPKDDKNRTSSQTPEPPKLRGRPPGSKNLSLADRHILGSTPRMPSGLRNSEGLNDRIAIMIPSRSPSQARPSPSAPKRSDMSSAKAIGPGRRRKTKNDDQPTSPKYQVYKCLWKDCRAKLHNLETLQKHVFKIHCKKENNVRNECKWSECASTHDMKDTPSSGSPKAYLRYPSEDLLKRHVEKSHLRQFAWELGDGPPTHPSDVDESDYLSDAQGRQVTPRIQEPRENVYGIISDSNPTTRRAIGVVIPRRSVTNDISSDVQNSPEDMDVDPSESDNFMDDVVEYIGP